MQQVDLQVLSLALRYTIEYDNAVFNWVNWVLICLSFDANIFDFNISDV